MTQSLDALLANVRPDRAAASDAAALIARLELSAIAEPGDATLGRLVHLLGEVDVARRIRKAMRDTGDSADRARAFAASILDAIGHDRPANPAPARELLQAFDRWRPRAARIDVHATLERAAAVSAALIVPGDRAWPAGLDDLGDHAPVLLWNRSVQRPAATASSQPAEESRSLAVAIVGSRASTGYGSDVAAELVVAAADTGATIVSGGAYGIDAVAHRAALGVGAPTVAFLAGGIDQFYPSGNSELLGRVTRDGAVMSEAAPGVRPTRWRFLNRNRLIAASAAATVVVEAGHRSGAINTAHHAAQLGRSVFAVPGPITSASSMGCHRLVAEGIAEILPSPEALTAALVPAAANGAAQRVVGSDDPQVIRVIDALDRQRALPVDEIAARSGLSLLDTTDALALAALQGSVTSTPCGWRIT